MDLQTALSSVAVQNAFADQTSVPNPAASQAPGDESDPAEVECELIIAIDFGTTYSGVAYSNSGADIFKMVSTRRGIGALRDSVITIRDWPNYDPMYPEKAATILAYEGGKPLAWGGSVKPSHKVTAELFKLGLQESDSSENEPVNAEGESVMGFVNVSEFVHPDLPNKGPIDMTADYLSLLRKHVLETSLRKHFGKEFLENQTIKYVLTVPAIWSDKARNATKRAAERAGIPEEDLDIVTEPEAAAIYCSTLCTEVSLRDGDSFLICDAGGGTVVCVLVRLRFLTC